VSSKNIKQFGKVVVLAGGTSRERDISLTSGNAVLAALKELKVDVELVDTQHLDINVLKRFDRAFIALHGLGGEDGQIQAVLECLNIPYTGSRVAASAITMDKVLTKKIWAAAGFKLAASFVVRSETEAAEAVKKLGLPVIFKPSLEGSSVGITLVESMTDINKAFAEANKPGQQVLVEKFIKGKEYSVGILDGEVLPSVRMSTKRAFYDFTAKYIDNDTEYFCPSGLSEKDEQEIQQTALAAFKEVGCSGWGRVDFIRNEKGDCYLLEVNTVPGLTSHSLVPMEARVKGYSFNELIIRILESTLVRDRT
jgi:D-alanine-D-alanine ligase